VLWARAASAPEAAARDGLFLAAIERLGDSRPVLAGGADTLNADMSEGVRLLYEQYDPSAALTVFDRMLAVNAAHYGARFQRARALTMLGRVRDARAAWTTVLMLANTIADQATIAAALTELKKEDPTD